MGNEMAAVVHLQANILQTINKFFLVIIVPSSYLFREYSNIIGAGFNVVWILMMMIGASSAYFHATLSLVGQLLDEVAILWVLFAAYALWIPEWMILSSGIFKTRLIIQLHTHFGCIKYILL